ncbi:MAG TPA: hypothetical protein DHW61_10125, partial [Lachnoclostridium phytofermentans]|nr:hypothetical protein [Lachnoclostridium phytofermentans]
MKNKSKCKLKHRTRIFISLGMAFVLAIIVMSIQIYFGYTNAYESGVDGYMVKVFGLEIYALIKSGDVYLGTSIGKNMGILC